MEQPLGADDSQETVFGGGRFNRFGMHIVVVVLIVAGCLMVYGIHRAGVRPAATASANNSNDDLRHKAIIGDLWAGASHSGSTAEIARAEPAGSDAGNDGRVPIPNVTLQPPASPYTVVTGSII